MNVIELTRKLVSIPSYVDADTNESLLAEFVFEYLQNLGKFHIKKQPVENGRFNIIAHDDHPPRLMFGCHMDTVPPSGTWQHVPFNGDVVSDRLYGLGACDMKGGIACLLHALSIIPQTQGLFLLFDTDEEYYFKGIRQFLKEYEVHPELALFTEPGMGIRNGHRGLIEVYFRVRGVTGHASRPQTGKNAILGATQAVVHLVKELEAYSDAALGQSSCNLAFLRGGVDRGEDENGFLHIEERANKIPDIAEAVIDIRPANSNLRAQTVLDILESYLNDSEYQMEKHEKRLDYGSLLIPKDRLTTFESIVQEVTGSVQYADIRNFGYGEAQLLNESLEVNCVYFGPGPDEMAHQADEYVSIKELHLVSEVYKRMIQIYCSKMSN